jgi:hypothetical protein
MPSPWSARGPSPRAPAERQLGALLRWLARPGAQPCGSAGCRPARLLSGSSRHIAIRFPLVSHEERPSAYAEATSTACATS